MKQSRFIIFGLILLLHVHDLNGDFSPDRTNYDSYGVKIAMNEIFLVQANNNGTPPNFLVQFAPYNNYKKSSRCFISYPDPDYDYVYCVAVASKPIQNQIAFLFAGETLRSNNRTFIGVAKYNLTNNPANSSISCDKIFSYTVKYIDNYPHQEYYIIGVQPHGLFAYGFANDFIFRFDIQNAVILNLWNSSLIWTNGTFIPHAVDISDTFGIVAGFIRNDPNHRVKFSPIIYLINFNAFNYSPIIMDQYLPKATPGTWQDLLVNANADFYAAKYTMSVSINKQGYVLVGMQFINRVFLLSVNCSNPKQLTYISRHTNGRSLGNGRSVAWLGDGTTAAILVNIYSLAYQWISSGIYFYDMATYQYNSNTTPLSIFPNYNQLLPKSFSSTFLYAVSSPTSLTLMDDMGNLLIFNPTLPGYYPSVPETGSSPFMTSIRPCLPGAYKDGYGLNDCLLCPNGTKAPKTATKTCVSCASDSICTLGSVADVPQSVLTSCQSVVSYPKSPESTIFEQILIENTFHIGDRSCLIVSPLFWSLIVAGIAMIVFMIVGILQCCTLNSRSTNIKKHIQSTFQKIDMIREGELWLGGIASLSLMVLLCFAYAFSNAYLRQYPIETSSDFHFACDKSIRNAEFHTSLQSLAIPRTEAEEAMFTLLNEQKLTLNVDFINTYMNCDVVSIQALFGSSWSTARWAKCQDNQSLLSLSIPLPFQHTTIEITLADTGTVGALRIGLNGQNHQENFHYLKDLETYQSFSKNQSVLARTLPVTLSITKVINETVPISGEERNYTGIFLVTYGIDLNSVFLSRDQYIRLVSTNTILTVIIEETPYYVKNQQNPIVRREELIFHNILFTVACFEIFGLIFILYKLILEPTYHFIYRILSSRCVKKPSK